MTEAKEVALLERDAQRLAAIVLKMGPVTQTPWEHECCKRLEELGLIESEPSKTHKTLRLRTVIVDEWTTRATPLGVATYREWTEKNG